MIVQQQQQRTIPVKLRMAAQFVVDEYSQVPHFGHAWYVLSSWYDGAISSCSTSAS